jgi:hypothetical protein
MDQDRAESLSETDVTHHPTMELAQAPCARPRCGTNRRTTLANRSVLIRAARARLAGTSTTRQASRTRLRHVHVRTTARRFAASARPSLSRSASLHVSDFDRVREPRRGCRLSRGCSDARACPGRLFSYRMTSTAISANGGARLPKGLTAFSLNKNLSSNVSAARPRRELAIRSRFVTSIQETLPGGSSLQTAITLGSARLVIARSRRAERLTPGRRTTAERVRSPERCVT